METRAERPRSVLEIDQHDKIDFKEIMNSIDPNMKLPDKSNDLLNLIASELTYQIINQSANKTRARNDNKINLADVEATLTQFNQNNINPNMVPPDLEEYKVKPLEENPSAQYLQQRNEIQKFLQMKKADEDN